MVALSRKARPSFFTPPLIGSETILGGTIFIYHLVVYKSVINMFNPEEKLERRFDLGYFTNKKKANRAFVDLCDEEIDWLLRVYWERIEVETDYPGELKTRVKKKGEIMWFVGTIENITVQ